MRYDIITFGSAVIDLFMDTSVKQRGGKFSFDIGDKLGVEDIHFSVGGGGSNTAVAFRKLGLRTGYFGKIGKGRNSEIILKNLKKNKVGFIGLRSEEHSDYSAILGAKKGGRTILNYKGASNSIREREIVLGKIDSKWVYFSSLMGDSFKTQLKLIPKLKRLGKKIALNPSQYQVRLGIKRLKIVLENTDVLIFNRKEAEILTGKKDLGKIFDVLHDTGVKIVSITDGNKGSVTSDGIYLYKARANKEINAVETTGAGDAFASGFVFGIVKNRGIEQSIQIGQTNAESVIQKHGAKNGLLSLREIRKVLKRRPVKIIVERGKI